MCYSTANRSLLSRNVKELLIPKISLPTEEANKIIVRDRSLQSRVQMLSKSGEIQFTDGIV